MERSYVICPKGGLCARLRVLLSWKAKAEADGRRLICHWSRTRLCNGLFTECFAPLDGVEFRDYEVDAEQRVDYEGVEACGDYDATVLEPIAAIMQRIKNNTDYLGDYDAIHVRRTDFVEEARKRGIFVSDEEYCKFIDDGEGKTAIYLATDNIDTQIYYAKKYTGVIRINKAMTRNNSGRNTTLENAVVDMYTCAAAKFFMGTKGSAFTDVIELLRGPESPYSYESTTLNKVVIPIIKAETVKEVAPVEEAKEEEVAEETVVEEVVEETVKESVEETKEAVEETKESEDAEVKYEQNTVDVPEPVKVASKPKSKNRHK